MMTETELEKITAEFAVRIANTRAAIAHNVLTTNNTSLHVGVVDGNVGARVNNTYEMRDGRLVRVPNTRCCKRRFAWLPETLTNGGTVWLKHYYAEVFESFTGRHTAGRYTTLEYLDAKLGS